MKSRIRDDTQWTFQRMTVTAIQIADDADGATRDTIE